MGVVSLYKRVGMVYEMWICNEKFFLENCPDGALWQGMIPLGGVFKIRNVFSAMIYRFLSSVEFTKKIRRQTVGVCLLGIEKEIEKN